MKPNGQAPNSNVPVKSSQAMARPSAAGGMAARSERERQIAALVADHRTNRETAARLYLSEKTVEKHLTRAFQKLGVRSRADLARLARKDLAG